MQFRIPPPILLSFCMVAPDSSQLQIPNLVTCSAAVGAFIGHQGRRLGTEYIIAYSNNNDNNNIALPIIKRNFNECIYVMSQTKEDVHAVANIRVNGKTSTPTEDDVGMEECVRVVVVLR